MLSKQIVRVFLNADMETSAGEGESIVQAGIFILLYVLKIIYS